MEKILTLKGLFLLIFLFFFGAPSSPSLSSIRAALFFLVVLRFVGAAFAPLVVLVLVEELSSAWSFAANLASSSTVLLDFRLDVALLAGLEGASYSSSLGSTRVPSASTSWSIWSNRC